jgi:hypothetical protein
VSGGVKGGHGGCDYPRAPCCLCACWCACCLCGSWVIRLLVKLEIHPVPVILVCSYGAVVIGVVCGDCGGYESPGVSRTCVRMNECDLGHIVGV